jgi:hypothetical protein
MPELLIWLFAVAVIIIAFFRWNLLRRSIDRVFREWLHPKLERNATLIGAYRSFFAILAIPFAFIGAYLAFQELMDVLRSPDVKLVFTRPNDPVFWIVNPSAKIVSEVRYQFMLFDLSLPGENKEPYLQLMIRTTTVGPIRPGGALGPSPIRSLSPQGTQVEKGHYLFGNVLIDCLTCIEVRYY